MVALFHLGFRGPPQGSQEPQEGGSGHWGVGAGHLEFQGGIWAWEWGPTCPQPSRHEQRMERQTAKEKKSILCPRSSRSSLIYLGGGLPPVGNPWLGGTWALPLGSFGTFSRCWHKALAGMWGRSRPQGGFRISKQDIGAQEHGNLNPRIQQSNPPVAGCLQRGGRVAVFFSLHLEPYVRAFLGKQEVLFAKFSTGSSTGLIPTHPARA